MNSQDFSAYPAFFNEFANPYAGMFLAGLFYGMTVCGFSCLPYIGTYIMGTQEGIGKGLKAVFIFSLSKIVTYTFLGALCGYIGGVVLDKISPEKLSLITGGIIFFIGIIVFLKPLRPCQQNSRKIIRNRLFQKPYLALIIMGVGISLVPCLPLTAVLLYSSTTHSIFAGGLISLVFSIGTSISPLYLFGGAAGWFSKKIRLQIPQHSRLLQRLNGGVLAFLGAKFLCMALF
jgi:thiol:disulfide interchange protein DsbD